MAWRPAPRNNPLLALRRVVERPDPARPARDASGRDAAGADGAERPGHTGTVRIAAAPSDSGDAAPPLFDGLEAAIVAGGSPPPGPPEPPRGRPGRPGGRGRPWPGIPSGRRRSEAPVSRPPASQPEPSHRDPQRSPQTLITTTPAAGVDLAGIPPLPPMTPRAAVIVSPAPPTPRRSPPRPAPAGPARHGPPKIDPAAATPGAAATPLGAPPTDLAAPPLVDPAAALPPAAPTRRAAPPLVDPAAAARGLARGRAAVRDSATNPAPGVPPSTARPLMGPRRALAVMLTCLGLWAVVDSPALYRSALASPIGTRRRAALDVLGPVSRATAFLAVDRIGRAADDLRGRHPHHAPTPPIVAAPILMGPPTRSPAPATPAPTVSGPLRVPSAAEPLRVLVVGDSLGLSFGQSLAAKLDASGVTKTTVDAREGTGLTRPDSFDWAAQLEADIVRFHPEVVVASIGGNDDQDVQVNGRYIGFGSPQWQDVYRSRVAKIADEVAAGHARLVWSGLPVMRSSTKNARLDTVMTVARTAIDGRPLALWVSNAATLADPSGRYLAALPDAAGRLVIVREPDGIHETRAGADRLADRTISAMVANWKLTTKPGPG